MMLVKRTDSVIWVYSKPKPKTMKSTRTRRYSIGICLRAEHIHRLVLILEEEREGRCLISAIYGKLAQVTLY